MADGLPGTSLLILAFHLAAGWALFVFFLNRFLNRMRGSLAKLARQLALLFFFTLAPLGLGWGLLQAGEAARLWRWAFPGAIAMLAIGGEMRRWAQRRRHAGAPPTEIEPPLRRGWAFLRRPVTTTDLTTLTYELAWQGPPLTLAHLSDLHLNHALPQAFYRQAVARASQAQPDLILLSGDFVSHAADIPLLPSLLRELRTTTRLHSPDVAPGRAIFASLGNHDYWSNPDAIRGALQEQGIVLLSGRCQEASVEGFAFRLCADDRPWGVGLEGGSASDQVGAGEEIPSLILSHSPDNIYVLAQRYAPLAVFSGHVHGGQIRLPLPWNGASMALVLPSSYGRRFDRGHFVFAGRDGAPVHLFISAGIGAAEPALRLYCPPELLIVRLRPALPTDPPSAPC